MNKQSATTPGWQLEADSAEAYERYLASAFQPWVADLIALAGLKPRERVLDAACGTGIVARSAAPIVGAGGKIVGIDINADMLRVARAVSNGVRPEIEWRQGAATELPFPDHSFDVVFCHQAVQFFPDPVAGLREMRRVLTRDGRAAVGVCRMISPNPAYASMASALERLVSAEAAAIMVSPFSPWKPQQFRDLFLQAGFSDVRVRIEARSLRYPSVEEFLRREAASSPLAGPVGALRADVRAALIGELEAALADYVDDEGVLCPIEVYAALAR
jgi:ubiquinone/menaquinone biosynthesis C-methylase UbiE